MQVLLTLHLRYQRMRLVLLAVYFACFEITMVSGMRIAGLPLVDCSIWELVLGASEVGGCFQYHRVANTS